MNENKVWLKNLLCKIGFHDLTQWELSTWLFERNGLIIGSYCVQKRKCNVCGVTKYKKDDII